LRKGFIIMNFSGHEMYIGDASVTDSTGIPLIPWESVYIDAGADCDWYVTTVAAKLPPASVEARVIEGY